VADLWVMGKEGVEEIKRAVMRQGLHLNADNPEVVLVLGGDGSILRANRKFPESSILPIIKNSFGGLGELGQDQLGYALGRIKKGDYEVEEVMRVEAQYKDFKTWGLNEVTVYRDDEFCNRMRVKSAGKDVFGHELIGDGIIACGPAGSTGYNYVAGGKVLKKTDRKFEVTPICSSYISDNVVNGRRVLTRINGGKVFNEGDEVIVEIERDIRNKIVPDALKEERKYFDFKAGDYVTFRSAKTNSRFVKIM
jgi:NAD kinase